MRASRRAMWTAAAVALLVVGALAIGVWSGSCVDYAAFPGECTSEPALGWPGAILVAVVCAACAAMCVRRAARRGVACDGDEPVIPR